MFKPLNKSMTVPVIDSHGKQLFTSAIRDTVLVSLPVMREFWNTPWGEFFPDEPIVIIDWKSGLEEIDAKIRKGVYKNDKAYAGIKGKQLKKKLQSEMFEKPILFDGKLFYGCFAWGSAVKNGQTIGMTHDFFVEIGLMHEAEDGPRISRAYLPNGMYGGSRLANPKILFLKPGEVWNGYRVDDGCGFGAQEDSENIKREGTSEIEYNPSAQSMYVWQRFPWKEIGPTAKKLIKGMLDNMDSIGLQIEEFEGELSKYKQALIEAEPLMKFHPYVAGSIRKSAKSIIIKIGTTVPLDTRTFYAVPTLCMNDFVFPEGVESNFGIVQTYPADDSSSTRAIIANEFGDKEWKAESKRLTNQQAVQYTLSGRLWTAKGSLQLIPKKLMGGYDFILCREDIKLHPELKKIRSSEIKELRMGDTVFSITQWVGPGQCAGVPNWDDGGESKKGIWKSMGRDTDGDIVAYMLIDDESFPIWQSARKWRGLTSTYKIPKTHSSLVYRIEMIINSILNMVGFATNNQALTYAGPFEIRPNLAKNMNFKNERGMDVGFNADIKDGTDCHKSRVDSDAIWARMAQRQNKLLEYFVKGAPWVGWVANDMIPTMLPDFEDSLPDHIVLRASADAEFRRSPEWRMHIQRQCNGSTIAEIWRYVRPWIVDQYKASIRAGIIPQDALPQFIEKGLKTMLLADFVDWVPPIDNRDMDKGFQQYQRFCVLASQVNMSSDFALESFKQSWTVDCKEWAEDNGWTMEYACWVMWRCAHHSRSSRAGAASVFIPFPEQCLKVVREKPGTMKMGSQIRTIVVGLNYNFDHIPDVLPAEGTVRVIVKMGFCDNQNRKMVVSVEHIDGQRQSDGMPENLLGMVSEIRKDRANEGFMSPPLGEYLAKFFRISDKTWSCMLSKMQ